MPLLGTLAYCLLVPVLNCQSDKLLTQVSRSPSLLCHTAGLLYFSEKLVQQLPVSITVSSCEELG